MRTATSAPPQIDVPTKLLVGGQWQDGSAGTIPVLNPSNGCLLAEVSAGDASDIDNAVQAARQALEGDWARISGAERGRLLTRVADLIERDTDIFARLEALDVGKTASGTALFDVAQASATFRHFSGWADKIKGEAIPTGGAFGRQTVSYTVREPVGVIGAIIPWNAPLMIAAWKLAPGLAAGNTFVVKPAEDAPLSILHLATLLCEAGLPDGTVNVVCGFGEVAGAALVRHPVVNKISFTGSPEVGAIIQKQAADDFKRLTLELGGKSPQIVLADADIEAAVAGIAMGLFTNSGQVCAAGTRILVHRSIMDEVVEGVVSAARRQVLGDPQDPATTMGALINNSQRDRVLRHVGRGIEQGAKLVTGGSAPDMPGFYVEPTVFTEVVNSMDIAQEEIFGPVGAIIPFDDTEEAIRIANDTQYGLAATLWTRDVSHAHSIASRVRAGAVWVNGWSPLDPALPWGGMKTSGVGRELGWSGILADTEEKVITIVL